MNYLEQKDVNERRCQGAGKVVGVTSSRKVHLAAGSFLKDENIEIKGTTTVFC